MKTKSKSKPKKSVFSRRESKQTTDRRVGKATVQKTRTSHPVVIRGANKPRAEVSAKRSVLGRGLSALMSPSPVRVESVRPDSLRHDALQNPLVRVTPVHFEKTGFTDEPIRLNLPGATKSPAERELLNRLTPQPLTETRDSESNVIAFRPAFAGVDSNLATMTNDPVEDETFDEEMEEDDQGLRSLPIDQISAGGAQPRRTFSVDEISSLARSIEESGLLQPIIVRKRSTEGLGTEFEIVAGERRFRAAKQAGLKTIPAIVRELSDKEALQIAIVENIQRADLNPIEEAEAYQRLIDEFGETQAGVANAVGKERVSVANALRLLRLPGDLKEHLSCGKISAGHARALLALEDEGEQRALAERIMIENLTVRSVEEIVSVQKGADGGRRKRRNRKRAENLSPTVVDLQDRLRRSLGTKVTLNLQDSGAGEIRVSFFSRAELDSLLERFGA